MPDEDTSLLPVSELVWNCWQSCCYWFYRRHTLL